MNLFTKLFAMTGQQTWELLAWTMCYFLVAGTAVALAGALLRFLCKRLAPQIRYTVSLAVFAILMALPFGIAIWLSPSMSIPVVPTPIVIDLADTPITMSPVEEPIEFTNIVIAEAQTPEAVPLIVAIARQNDTALVERLVDRAIELLPWLWLIGTPLTFLLLATGLIGSNRLRRKCKQLTEGPIFEACERLRTTLTVSQRVGIAINERIATPLLIGIVRPMILLPPAALTGWSPDELEMVLLHELAHVRRWDNFVNFGQRLVESLLFFHPAVWWVSRWVRRDREECCDAVVVARTEKPQAYAELLVALATPPSLSSPPLAGLAMAQHPLAGRIRRILHLEEEKMLITRSTLGLVGFFVVALLGIVLWQPVTATLAKESVTEVSEQKDIATEDTESTEEADQATEERSIILSVNTPVSEINAFIKRFQADGKSIIRIRKNEDNSITITTLQENLPTTTITARKFELFNDGEIKAEGLIHATMPKPPSPFPTLEAQRSADLAFKLLHVELKPLNKEELARVKAMKFTGGLRVAHTEMSRQGIRSTQSVALPGDLLVGLHVWPTTSLAEVKKVLERDDLEDLSPLKFYVIRQFLPKAARGGGGFGGEMSGYGGEYAAPEEQLKNGQFDSIDQLVTGRIEVNIDAIKKNTPGPDDIMTPVPTHSPPQPVYFPSGPHTAGVITPYPGSIPNIVIGRPIDPVPIKNPGFSNQPLQPKPTLFYDGKTFNHWRSQWKNELSIKNRTETVQAMAAFGNAGRGKKAAEVILEIAGQYDWKVLGDGSIGQLQKTCMNAFGKKSIFGERAFGSFPNTLPHKEAKEVLLAAMHSKNVRARAFVEYVLPSFESLLEAYQELWKTDEELRKYTGRNLNEGPTAGAGLRGGLGGGGGGGF